jgi:hypothetical protein
MPSARLTSGLSFVAVCLVALSGCGGSQDAAVESVAQQFYAAIASQDGKGACTLLAPATRAEVEQASRSSCADGLLEEDVPSVTAAEEVSVFGTMGRVRYEGETTYLTRFGQGWLVMAAGCTPMQVGPDDCTVRGG